MKTLGEFRPAEKREVAFQGSFSTGPGCLPAGGDDRQDAGRRQTAGPGERGPTAIEPDGRLNGLQMRWRE